MLEYKFYKILPEHNIICSIDNLVMFFYVQNCKEIIDFIHDNFDTEQKTYYENLDKAPSSKYSYWRDNIHCSSLYIRLGKYSYRKDTKGFDTVDMISFEINPNKHFNDPEYKLMETIINRYSFGGGGYVKQFDFAIDLPIKYDDVLVFPENNKVSGLYKGTRYYGSGHNTHGFTKCYDKTKESKLDYDLTRLEITFQLSDHYKIIDFGIRNMEFKIDLKGQMKALALAVKTLESIGLPTEDILSPLAYRQRVRIRESIEGGIEHICISESVIKDLLEKVALEFNVKVVPSEKKVEDFKPRSKEEDWNNWFDNLNPEDLPEPF